MTLAPIPDESTRQAQLDAMKHRATGLLALAAVVFAAASVFERRYPWLGYVRAMAEASIVGGLADWFAVTALFRHPLGIPIPHTAIVARQKDRIGRALGRFVQDHFLTGDVIGANLRAVHPALRAARWLSDPEHSRRIARQIASGLAKTIEALPDEEVRELTHQVVIGRLRALRVAPAIGRALGLLVAGDLHQELLDQVVRLAVGVVRDNRDLSRERVRAESPWWVPGAVDDRIYERIVSGVEGLLQEIANDPTHTLRGAFDAALRDVVDRLRNSPDIISRAETVKEELLKDPALADLSARLWESTRRAIVAYSAPAPDAPPRPLERGLSEFGSMLLSNEGLLEEIDNLTIELATAVVERYRHEIGNLIAQTVASWDPDATSRRFELAVGRDLQFVRINGTLVGGLVGLLIYALSRLRP